MIPNIHIQRFRCFDDLFVEGFKTVNLIGGQNNAGKTALLEALLLGSFPFVESIALIRKLREISDQLIKAAPEKVWGYFFYNQSTDREIRIDLGGKGLLKIEFPDKHDTGLIKKYAGFEGVENVNELLFSRISHSATLHFSGNYLEAPNEDYGFLLFVNNSGEIVHIGNSARTLSSVPFLLTRSLSNSVENAALFSKVKGLQRKQDFIQLLTIMDEQIMDAEIDSPNGVPLLMLVTKSGGSLPVNMFGDGIRRMVELLLLLLTSESSSVYIDEIENGLHFSKQREIWRFIFKICNSRKIQLFATSHSLEMIQAFDDVCLEGENANEGMYFEMGRGRKSGNIVVNTMTPEMLRYEISRGLAFRGE